MELRLLCEVRVALGAPLELGSSLRGVRRVVPIVGGTHLECWLRDPDGYVVVLASQDGETG